MDSTPHYQDRLAYQNSEEISLEAQIEGLKKELELAGSPMPRPAIPKPVEDVSTTGDIARGLVKGPVNAFMELMQTTNELGEWLEAKMPLGRIDFGEAGNRFFRGESKPIGDTKTMAGGATEGISQFMTGFLPILKAMKGLGIAARGGALAQTGKATVAGIGADLAVFDPDDPTIGNLMEDLLKKHPNLSNPITEAMTALSTDPDDSGIEKRFKRAVEGAAVGVAADGLFQALRTIVKGRQAARALKEVDADIAADPKATGRALQDVRLPENEVRVQGGHQEIPQETVAQTVKQADIMSEPLVQRIRANRSKPLVEIQPDRAKEIAGYLARSDFEKAAKGDWINLDRIEGDQDYKKIIDRVAEIMSEDELVKATRGKRTNQQILKQAKELGLNESEIAAMAKQSRGLAERVTAMRLVHAASSAKLKGLMEKAAAPVATVGDALEYQRYIQVHAGMVAHMKGVQTEVARALQAFRIIADPGVHYGDIDALMRNQGDLAVIREHAKRGLRLTSIGKNGSKALDDYIRKSAMGKARDAGFAYYVNALLSSGYTHIVNITSNSLVPLFRLMERGVAGSMNLAARSPDGVRLGEVGAQVSGFLAGLREATRVTGFFDGTFKKALGLSAKGDFKGAKLLLEAEHQKFGTMWRTLGTNDPIMDPLTKFEHRHAAVSSKALELPTLDFSNGVMAAGKQALGDRPVLRLLGSGADVLGTVIGMPTRMLLTADEFFKAINYRGELYAQAYRKAANEGLSGRAFKERMTSIIDDTVANPDAYREFHDTAIAAAREGTFTSELGATGRAITRAIDKVPGGRILVPFIRTPTNLLKYVGERTPGLNMLAQSMRDDLAAGGARAQLAAAKWVTGTMLFTTGYMLASQGKITGGFSPKGRGAQLSGKFQDYSLRIGGTYNEETGQWEGGTLYKFNRLDPFGMFLGLAADGFELSGRVDDTSWESLAAHSILAFSKNVMSKTWMTTISQVMEAIEDPERYGAKTVRNLLTSWVPALSREIRIFNDPEIKEVLNLRDAFNQKIPGRSHLVEPKIDLFGDVIEYEGGVAYRSLSPYNLKAQPNDPVRKELVRLGTMGVLDVRPQPKQLDGVDLNNQQYRRLGELSGEGLHDRLTKLLASNKYKNGSDGFEEADGSRPFMIQALISAHRQMGRAKLLREDRDLMRRFRATKRAKGKVLQGKVTERDQFLNLIEELAR